MPRFGRWRGRYTRHLLFVDEDKSESVPADLFHDCFTVRTGSGKLHYYLRHNDETRKWKNYSSKETDENGKRQETFSIRLNGHYVAGPGVIHPDTKQPYEIIKDISIKEPTEAQLAWMRQFVERETVRIDSIAGPKLHPDFSMEAFLKYYGVEFKRAGTKYHVHFPNQGCPVAGHPHRVDNSDKPRAIEQCSFMWEPGHPPGFECLSGGCDGKTFKDAHSALIKKNSDKKVFRVWDRQLFDSLEDFERCGDLKPHIEGISYLGEVTGNVALQKHGKSWYIKSKMKALLSGNDWMGHKVSKAERVVLFIPEVGRSSEFRRLKAMRLDKYLGKTLFVRTSALGVPDLRDSEILDACAGADVFIDTLIRFLDGPENNAEVISRFADKIFNLMSFARYCEINCHTQKSYQSANDMDPTMFRGSSDIAAFLSNGYGLYQVDRATNTIFVKSLFSRDLPDDVPNFTLEGRPWIDQEGDFHLKSSDAGELRDNRNGPLMNATHEQQETLRTMHGFYSLREIANAVGVKSPATIRTWMIAMSLDPKEKKASDPVPDDVQNKLFKEGKE